MADGPTSTAESRWVVLPVAEQASGASIDEIRRLRLREQPLAASPIDDGPIPRGRVEVFRGHDADAELAERFYRRGWTDGLPIVAPTLYRVAEMLRYAGASPGDSLGAMEPLQGIATAEKLAANAVMAGCRPEYFPVVLAATRALVDPAFNLRGVQTTDENVTPLVIVSGPIAPAIELNPGIGALGPGWQANATIGRALRLIMSNVGGGWPGVVSLAGIGQPGRYTLCLAERQQPPWPLLHEESGFVRESNAVTVMRAETAINVTGDLDDIASVMATAASAFSVLHGGRVAVLLAPAVAARLAGAGWRKADVARYLFDNARIPVANWMRMWIRTAIAPGYGLPSWVQEGERRGAVPVVEAPEHIVVFVAGGDAPIAQHVYFPSWGFPPCRVVQPIQTAPGLEAATS